MAYRIVTQAEREMEQIPSPREATNFERIIKKNMLFAPREQQKPVIIPPPPKPAPQPTIAPVIPKASVADTIIPDKDITTLLDEEPVKVVHDLPLDPEFLFKKRTTVFRPIPMQPEPIVAEAQATVGNAASPKYVPEFSDVAEIYGKPAQVSSHAPSAIAGTKFQLPAFRPRIPTLPKLDYGNGIMLTFFVVKLALAAALVYFGLTMTGSYYVTTSRLQGDLATFAYKYQIGTLIAFIGVMFAYDTIRFRLKKEQ